MAEYETACDQLGSPHHKTLYRRNYVVEATTSVIIWSEMTLILDPLSNAP